MKVNGKYVTKNGYYTDISEWPLHSHTGIISVFYIYTPTSIINYPLYPVFYYSLLSAITGSFLAASLDGISPPINVSITLMITSITPPFQGSADTPATLI